MISCGDPYVIPTAELNSMSFDRIDESQREAIKAPDHWIINPALLLNVDGWQELSHPARYRAEPTTPNQLVEIGGFPFVAEAEHSVVSNVSTNKPVALLDDANLDELHMSSPEGTLQQRHPYRVLPLSRVCDDPSAVVALRTPEWYEAGSAKEDSLVKLPSGSFEIWGKKRLEKEFGITIKSSGQ